MLLLLLIGLLVLMCVGHYADLQILSVNMHNELKLTHSLNRSEPAEFALKILLRSIIAKPCNNECLKGIASDIGIFLRLVCDASSQYLSNHDGDDIRG